MRRHQPTSNAQYRLSSAAVALLIPIFLLLPTANSAAQGSKRLIFALSTKDSSTAPILTALHFGYFKDEGIDANIVLMRSDIGVKALVTGDADFAASVSSVIKATAVGIPVKTVLNFFNGSFFYLITKPNYTNIQQLRGKTIGVSRYGSAADFDARATFRHFGIDPSKDLKILAAGTPASRISALVAGHVDAVILSNTEKLPAEQAGMKALLFTGQYVKQPVGGLGTSVQRLSERREDIQKGVRAVYRGLLAMKSQRDRVKMVFEKELGVKSEQFDGIYEDTVRVLLPNGTIDLESLREPYEDARRQATNPPQVALANVIDYSVLEEVRKTLK
jgi:ABC-type nitrate/sulfonate/bicarbonate transport system substrate-binding protein